MLYRFGIDPSLRAILRGILTSRIAQSLGIELANASARCSRPVAIWQAFDESASMRHGLVWIYGPTAILQRGFKCMPGGLVVKRTFLNFLWIRKYLMLRPLCTSLNPHRWRLWFRYDTGGRRRCRMVFKQASSQSGLTSASAARRLTRHIRQLPELHRQTRRFKC